MKKLLVITLAMLSLASFAQQKIALLEPRVDEGSKEASELSPAQAGQLNIRCIAFYNLENLFDTIHDEGKNDYEYLPDGGMKWTSYKYENKVKNMAYAVSQLGTDYVDVVN